MASGIRRFRRNFGERARAGYLVHPGDTRLPLGDDITALPLFDL